MKKVRHAVTAGLVGGGHLLLTVVLTFRNDWELPEGLAAPSLEWYLETYVQSLPLVRTVQRDLHALTEGELRTCMHCASFDDGTGVNVAYALTLIGRADSNFDAALYMIVPELLELQYVARTLGYVELSAALRRLRRTRVVMRRLRKQRSIGLIPRCLRR